MLKIARLRSWTLLSAAALLPMLAVACKKDEPVPLAASASAVSAAAPPPSAMVMPFVIGKDGKTSIDMDAPKEHIKAETTASDGTLQVDLKNLANTRGEVKADLSTLKTKSFDDKDKNDTQTEHAHNWLEVGSLVDDATRKQYQYAVFAIQSVDGLSASDVSKIAATKEGSEDVKTATLTAHGDFLLHGHKVAKDATLEVKFHFASGATPDSKPTRIDIKSKVPLHITLAEHDVKPRDNFGKVASWTTNLVSKVATQADVTLDFSATPQ